MPSTVFITGSRSGIGLATARLFHENGWNVVATVRSTKDTSDLEQIRSNSDRVIILPLDLSNQSTIQPAIDASIAKFGKIDLLVNNAGYGQNGLFEMVSKEKVQEQFDVNLFGPMDVIRAILPHFRHNKSGGIINVSSGAGLFTLPMISLYCASKFALEGFTESLAFELASQNIFVKSVIPHGGVTSTNFGSRSGVDLANQMKQADPTMAKDYAGFIEKTTHSFTKMVAARSMSSDDVAKVILEAALDGSNKLRYPVGNDTWGFLKARYESGTDDEYIASMRSFFK